MRASFALPLALVIATEISWAHEPLSPSSASAAARFIGVVSAKAPTHDGVPLRTYEIRDLNHDRQFEVLEHVSAYEDSPGFLNIEIESAFEWINVYREKDGRFVEATKDFPWFLTQRKTHYEFWLRVFDRTDVLNEDSKRLVTQNKERFRKVLSDYLHRLERLSR